MTQHTNRINDTTTEYPIAAFWRWFCYIFFGGIILLTCWLLSLSLQEANKSIPNYVAIPIALLVITGCGYMFKSVGKEKLTIDTDHLVYTSVRTERVIYFKDIRGFKMNDKYLVIVPYDASMKNLQLGNHFARYGELKAFLAQNFTDLDKAEYDEELNNIMADSSLGFTEEDREQKLERAKLLCRIVNWPSCVLAAVLFFYPTPYLPLMTVGMAYPLIAIAVLKSNRLIRFDEEKNSPYPSVIIGFLAPLFGVGMRLLTDLSLLNFNGLWLVSGGLFIVLLLILISGHSTLEFNNGKKIATSIFLMAFVYAYCFAASVAVNCLYDHSAPTQYAVKVIDKSVSRGRHTSYHLVLESWGPQTTSEQESVGSDLYNDVQVGDQVTVTYQKGLIGAGWYTIY